MNILLESRAFYPSVGGLEMMSRGLATAWQDVGHTVRVVTITPLDGDAELDALTVERQPSPAEMQRHVQWADVFVQSGISLRSLHWPVWTGTPLVIIHHNLLSGGQDTGVRAWLKRRATHLGANVAVSGPVAETVPGPVVRIPNTFRPVYDQPSTGEESRDGLLFVGRLVSVKGADLAVEALRRLRKRGIDTTLTICGDGPERDALERQAKEADLEDAVKFEGWTEPDELADRYRHAELLLVPSRYEPFGIVALETLASGCPVVAAETGGLPEAVGDCGLLVPPDDAEGLADATERALRSDVRDNLRAAIPAHVNRHRVDRIATEYLHLLRRVVQVN
ncbi:glycosyltransferase involved in cell wall biosynthesis [Salinibacter ruber]|uniref:glycosyltransferase family 4 protein n=1 Tax=Salinibacter ruber TaxID=146919 RepID=UPI002168AA1E|nr:glycosyltransferase involved in cell wall biosynthesis [Salinibacter ruber]